MKTIQVGNLTIDGSRLFLIAGPCVIEGYDRTLMIGREVKRICEKLGVQYIFKASFDKANRSSYHSFRGPGLEEGLRILKSIKKELDVPVLSDVHDVTQLEKAAEVLDMLQIPAFLCRQTDLVYGAAMTGKPVNVKKGKEILKVKNLKNDYIDDISFTLHESEILGISGLMGAVRTELVRTIYGHLKKQSGVVLLNGSRKNIKSAKEGIANGIAYVSEDRKGDGLVLGLSVKENMTISSLGFFSTFFKINKKVEKDSVEEYVEKFSIKTPTIDQKIKNLSGGNQQKVAIAKALLTNPKILILDEPTRGVDVGAKKEIYDFINELKKKGLSIIIVSSEMPEILGLSDRILVIHNHKITGEFTGEEATQEKIMRCAVGGNNVKKTLE